MNCRLVLALLAAVVAATQGMSMKPPPRPMPVPVDICALKAETGRCRMAARRWFFNSTTNKCETFTYGGCGGNPNNFKSLEDCESKCPGKTTCPEMMCALFCQFGFEVDDNGCKKCTCKKSPCADNPCKPGEACEIPRWRPQIGCVGPNCPPAYNCYNVEQRNNMCERMCNQTCATGVMIADLPCPRCECPKPVDPCETHKCPAGEKCIAPRCLGTNCPTPKPACIKVCPLVMCRIKCQWGFRKDENGCQLCKCAHPCDNNTCKADEKCEVPMMMAPVRCLGPNCPPAYNCYNVEQRKNMCKRMCNETCATGVMVADMPCPRCECPKPEDPCMTHKCPAGEICKAPRVACAGGRCPAVAVKPVCIKAPCPAVRCAAPCPAGYRKDSAGCQTCTCNAPKDPCENNTCKAGEKCEVPHMMGPVVCQGSNCPPAYICYNVEKRKKMCENMCAETCATGVMVADLPCPVCKCPEPVDPCKQMKCPAGQRCVQTQVACIKAPCPPVAMCQPMCPLAMCKLNCPWGFKKDNNGCQMCACAHPCDNNTCKADEKCEVPMMMAPVRCLGSNCPPAYNCYNVEARKSMCEKMCNETCTTGVMVADLPCPVCKCPKAVDPCKTHQCPAGQMCVVPEIACAGGVCPPGVAKPACVPRPCPVHDCPMDSPGCPNGYKLDENGCQTCECNKVILNPCQNKTCGAGEKCVVSRVRPVATCVNIKKLKKMCNRMCMSSCNKRAPVPADLPCPACKCPTDACETMKCVSGKMCKSRVVCFGKKTKCVSKGRCVKGPRKNRGNKKANKKAAKQ